MSKLIHNNIYDTMKNIKKITLTSIVPYEEDGHWFFHLIYDIKYNNGDRESCIIPKLSNPFPIDYFKLSIDRSSLESPLTYTSLSREECYLEDQYGQRFIIKPDSNYNYYEIIQTESKKPKVEELTIQEIEERLGYPIKVIKDN